MQNKTVQSIVPCTAAAYDRYLTLAVGIAGGVIGVVARYGNAFSGAVARLIIVDALFYITLDAGNAAAIGRTAKIAHKKISCLI